MFRFILSAAFLCLAVSAHAEVYEIQPGQNAQLNSGDVAVLRADGLSSAVTCGAGGTLPTRQQFSVDRIAAFPDIYQSGDDSSREFQCQIYSALQPIKQAISDAQYAAREQCFNAGYRNCAPPDVTDQQYSFHVEGAQGHYICRVIARIIGTNP